LRHLAFVWDWLRVSGGPVAITAAAGPRFCVTYTQTAHMNTDDVPLPKQYLLTYCLRLPEKNCAGAHIKSMLMLARGTPNAERLQTARMDIRGVVLKKEVGDA